MIEDILDDVHEREKRTILRKLRKGIIDYDPKLKVLVHVDTKEEYIIG